MRHLPLKSFAYYDLIEAFAEPGCPVCRMLRRDVARLLDTVLYEYATDRGMQARFRASRGLCAEHGDQLTRNNNALAIAVLYEQSLHEILELSGRPALADRAKRGLGRLFSASGGTALADTLEPTQTCLACETRASRESGYVRALTDDFGDAAMQTAYRASQGLCVEHFRQTLRQSSAPEDAAAIVDIQREIWTRLRAELNEYMRKNDTTYSGEAMGAEADSWRRAVRLVSGDTSG